MKTALLVVSFGTTDPEILNQTVGGTEKCLSEAFPDAALYRAFTSRIVRNRLERSHGIRVDDVPGALARIHRDGYTHVLVQPTLIIPGGEYVRLLSDVHQYKEDLTVSVGEPLLVRESDGDRMADILRNVHEVPDDTSLLFLGHGSDQDHGTYELLNTKLSGTAMRVCTMESYPTLTDGIRMMRELGNPKVRLIPLLFVAGNHAKTYLTGTDPSSLRFLLEQEGFSVEAVLRGLGDLEEIRAWYADKARDAYGKLVP